MTRSSAIEMKTSRQKAAEKKVVGIWIRVSTEDQAKGESPEHHERRARMYAEAKGWSVARVYDLSAVSGKSVMEHPECQTMLTDVREGRIEGLIFSKLARLARNTRELLEFAEYFKEHTADLISLQESIDTSTPAGRFFYTLIAGMAQWEREEIADRVKASVKVRAQMGKPTGGAAPFGYQWKDKQLIPDPDEAPVRRLVHELFAQHQRVKTVASMLNVAGHRTRRGAKFSDTTVRRLLEDPTAKGLRRANYTESLGQGKHWSIKPEDEWIWTKVEPVVSETVWDECYRILEERRRGRKPAKRVTHLFSGKTVCYCGKKMYVPSNTPKYVCYDCRNKIPKDDLEQVFQSQLKGFILDPERIEQELSASDRDLQAKRELAAAIERELAHVRSEMDKVYQLYLDDEITTRGFGERNRPLEERLEELENEIPRLQGEIDFVTIQHLSSLELVSEAQDLYSRWDDLSFEEKRIIVENIVERIVVDTEAIDIDLAFLPPSPSQTETKGQRNLRGSSPRRG